LFLIYYNLYTPLFQKYLYDQDATNESGFSGLPGGYRNYGNGNFSSVGGDGFWWSSTESSTSDAWIRRLYYFTGTAQRDYIPKKNGLSVRCLRD
jgi:uncharacterized protein (TIGR02145 family)